MTSDLSVYAGALTRHLQLVNHNANGSRREMPDEHTTTLCSILSTYLPSGVHGGTLLQEILDNIDAIQHDDICAKQSQVDNI